MSIRILHAYKGYKPDPTGGVAEVIEMLVGALSSSHQNSILVARARGLSRTFTHAGVEVQAVTSFGTISSTPIAPTYPFVLAKSLQRTDLLVHHAPFPLTDLGLLLPGSRHVKLVVHWHADLVRSEALMRCLRPLVQATLRRADRIIVAHESLILNSRSLRPFGEKCTIIPFGIDTAYWGELDADEAAQAAEIRRQRPRLIVSIGRLVPYKGFDILLDALAWIEGNLLIVGTGPLLGQLQRKARDSGLQDRVFFAGHQTRRAMKTMLHAARVFVLPSVTSAEAFGLAQLEAMAAGLPVVNTTLQTAVPHVARHGREGLSVPPRDSRALASALTRLLDDEVFATQLAAAGQKRARECFDRKQFLSKVYETYCETTAAPKA